MAEEVRPCLISWSGKSEKMDNDEEDCGIWSDIAQKMGLEFSKFDISESESFKFSKKLFLKYGEYSTIYSGNKKWFNFFEGDNSGFWDCGLFGERLKTWSLFDRKVNREEFVRGYIRSKGLELEQIDLSEEIKTEYVSNIKRKLYQYIDKTGSTGNVLDRDVLEILAQDYWSCGHYYMSDFFNIFTYSFPVFGEQRIVELIKKFTCFEKSNKRLSLRIIKEMQPELVDIPFFCTRKWMIFDKESGIFRAENERKNKKMIGIREKVKDNLLKSTVGKNLLNFYRRKKYGNVEEKRKIYWIDKINKTKIAKQISLSLNEHSLYHMEHYVSVLSKLILLELASECEKEIS